MNLLTSDGLEVRFLKRTPLGPVTLRLGPGVWRVAGTSTRRRTALMLCLAGQRIPSVGEVRLNGTILHDMPIGDRDRLVSWLPTTYRRRWTMPVDAVWRMYAATRDRPDWDGDRWREGLGLAAHLDLRRATENQHRAAEILAAIAGDPPFLVWDEPFARLDPAVVQVVAGWLQEWRKDRVIVLTGRPLPIEPDATLRLVRREALVYPPISS